MPGFEYLGGQSSNCRILLYDRLGSLRATAQGAEKCQLIAFSTVQRFVSIRVERISDTLIGKGVCET
jgi:hypothetical protein